MYAADYISDRTGFTVNSFEFEIDFDSINDEFAHGGETDSEDFYEKLQVHVQGVGTIYEGQSLREATEVFDEYYANHPHAEIVMVDEKYGDEIKWANVDVDD